MVSFDVQSLFTSIPVLDCIEIVRGKLKDNNMPIEYAELLKHCLTSGYLMWKDEFYIQVDGVAMGSPVSPVVADIFMEDFEVRALCSPPIRPLIYKRYVDDTFTILNKNKTSAFLNHLNSINNKIQFTIELEANNSLAFLDILVIRNPDNTLGHTVYRKPTHTDRYLNGNSHHHPIQLATVGKSLLQRAQYLCDADHLEAELQHVKHALTINNLPVPRQHRKNHLKPPTVERQPAILPYVKGVTDRIGNILKKRVYTNSTVTVACHTLDRRRGASVQGLRNTSQTSKTGARRSQQCVNTQWTNQATTFVLINLKSSLGKTSIYRD
ncbi:uncharacterized protein LOC133320089 [Danaus plexippus]|uniref:uncharacterized protein LOC133320089 n=1 Tax=Danaus plexippus TaxID=13037 RepID=UPI002AB17AF8|nr:uncharacterized protein LOC133320089 [Danaus plexippus]